MSFEQIHYKGKALKRVVDNRTQTTQFSHIYLTGFFATQGRRKHYCLQRGYWCKSQAVRHPIEAIRYALRRLRG